MNDFLLKMDEILEEPLGTLTLDTVYKLHEYWDSLARLSTASMVDEQYHVRLTSEDINTSGTLGHLWEIIQSKMD